MNNLLCDVPDDLFTTCFLPFWNIQEAIQLDKAMNNRAMRKELSEKLKGHVFTAARPFKMDIHAWSLLAKRELYVDNYYIPRDDMLVAVGGWPKLNAIVTSVSLAERNFDHASFVFGTYLNSCPKLTKLDLKGAMDRRVQMFEFISPQLLAQLTWLSLENYLYLDMRSLPAIGKYCTNLWYFDISGTSIYMSTLHAESIAKLTHLTHLGVGFCEVTNETLSIIATGCSQLTSINLSGCIELTDTGVETIAQCLPRLKVLNIAHCYLVTDNALLNLLISNPFLEEVNFENCLFLTERSLVSMGVLCRNLRCINLSKVPEVTDRFLLVAAGLPKLTELNLSNNEHITDENVILIAQSPCGGKLTTLNLAWCVNLTDASVLTIAEHCANLQHLNLDSSLQAVEGPVGLEVGGRTLVTGASVAVLATCCVHLVSLNVANVIGVNDTTVSTIAQHCHKLHHLNLYGCNFITNAAVANITSYCTRLRTLNISCCRKVTSLADIHKRCPHLQCLNIKGCVDMHSVCMSSAARECTNLKELNMQGCQHVNDHTVVACKNVRRINIAGCPLVNNRGVEEIVMSSMMLRYINISGCSSITGELISFMLSRAQIEVVVSAKQLALSNHFNGIDDDDESMVSEESEGAMQQMLAGFEQAQQQWEAQTQQQLLQLQQQLAQHVAGLSSSSEDGSSDGSGDGSSDSGSDSGSEDEDSDSGDGDEVVNLSGAGAFSSEDDEQP